MQRFGAASSEKKKFTPNGKPKITNLIIFAELDKVCTKKENKYEIQWNTSIVILTNYISYSNICKNTLKPGIE